MKKLYRTTIEIWTEYDPEKRFSHKGKDWVDEVVSQSIDGDAYLTKANITAECNPDNWPETEFFDSLKHTNV